MAHSIIGDPTTWLGESFAQLDGCTRDVFFQSLTVPAGTVFQSHSHPWWQFACARKGIIQVRIDEATLVIMPQFGMWIPANVNHSIYTPKGADLYCAFIKGDSSLANRLTGGGRVVAMTDLTRELMRYVCTSISKSYDENGSDGRKVNVLIDLLSEMKELTIKLPMPRDFRLAKVCDAIQSEPGLPHGIKEWAEKLNMSERTLARHFQRETGMTFQIWRQRMRLLRSISLLRDGRNVTAIALDLGYGSTSAYIFAFRKLFGVPPARAFEEGKEITIQELTQTHV